MYPSWGNYGGSQSQNHGGSGARKPPAGGHPGQSQGFGNFEASSGGSLFSSLQEQHLQQMQQLQMLHQKQLQSVLHHGNNTNSYGGGHPGPSAHQQDHPQPPLPPESQPEPPPPEPSSAKPLESNGAPKAKQDNNGSSKTEDETSLPLQEQQQLWYKQHLENLQKLKQEKAKQSQNQKDSDGPATGPLKGKGLPPPPSEPRKGAPPPPPPKEEPPEAARLQQLQAAAAQWQQVQQQRAGLQYQALMQQHEKLQNILEQYQQLIPQPPNLHSMSAEMQLRHYEMQQQQFTPLFQDWDRSFGLWYEQFQTYPHKDQLQDYEHQWKQWQEQMNATNAHLQERVATLTAMVPFATNQYNSGMIGQYGHYPGQDIQIQQSVKTGIEHPPAAIAPGSQGPPPTVLGPHSDSPAGTPVRGAGPGMGSRPLGPPVQPPNLHGIRGPRANNPRFDQTQQDTPPRFDHPQHRFDGPPRFDSPQQRFDGPPRFDPPWQRFDAPPRFDQPRQRFDGPPRFDQPRQRFDGPPRFDQPLRGNQPRFGQQSRFELPRLPGPPPRFERPPAPQQKEQQGPPSKAEPATKQPANIDSKTLGKSLGLPDKEKCLSESADHPDDMTDDNLLSNDGFFVQSDPIPQTMATSTDAEKSTHNIASDNSDKSKPADNKTLQVPLNKPTTVPSCVVPKNTLPRPPPGRGRGQPPVPVQARGRGQRGRGGIFTGPNSIPLGGEMGETTYEYGPPEEDLGMSEEQDEYNWQDPAYEEFGEDSEAPPEEMWVPDEHYYPKDEDYYEEPVGDDWEERRPPMRPPMRGMRPPFPPGRGRPPRGHPPFMHPGRGRPPHPAHRPIDHKLLGHGMDPEDTEMDSRHPMYHDPHSHPMHPEAGRGRPRGPPLPPPHEMRDPSREPVYDEEMEGELSWKPPYGRGRPMAPHEIIDRGGMRRRPMGRGMARGMWRPGPSPHEDFEEGYHEGYVEDYGHGEDGYRWRPPQDYPPDDYRPEDEYRESEWDRDRPLPERSYPPRMQPPESYREDRDRWAEERERERERERGHPYSYDEHDRARGELRVREYRDEPSYRQEEPPYPPPPSSEWDRSSRLPPPSESGYTPDYDDHRLRYKDHREESAMNIPPLPAAPVSNLPESSGESAPQGSGVLALSQRQHEIILKAGMSASAQAAINETVSWDTKPAATDYQPSHPPAATPALIPKTVDYGHGHEPGATVERISYGERIVLRPDPMPADRGYEKELLGPRDPYSRDPFYDRRPDPYLDRREYSRERESYREKLPPEYERERFERERFPPRDDKSLPPPVRPGYRERERDVRERDRSGSRDRDDHYGRSYDRPLYERAGLDRGVPERYAHGSSPYVDRRSYPDDRGPPAMPTLPPPPQPPPRVEKKPEIKNIDDILKPPGRLSRPERIVIIMRGLPGSGKSHVAKLIRDKEVDCGGAPPRVLVLDDYFMTEVEKTEKDPDTGKRVKTKVLEYEYEPEMEDTYRSSMLKTFKKTLDDGFFPFIILDTINDRVKQFDQFWSAAKTKGFEVYLAEITADSQTCAKRNVHGRTLKDIMKMSNNWEPSPRHMVRLDVRSLLQDAAIEEVEMEDFNPDDEPQEPKREEEEEGDMGYIPKSKWEMDTSEAKLDRLDGLGSGGKRKRDGEDMAGIEDFLQLPDDYATRMSQPGKKRVRWADLEEQKDADRKRAIGFVVGQTDWERITDESGQLAQRALNRTKYF
uniref:YLP motif-containing protein 1 n=1 Tax=Sphaeramia orbicularis TaxID=375764 RepID=A0A673BTQ4_9TELE